jgi:diketogulonate reductase-like aldo/keto reductase
VRAICQTHDIIYQAFSLLSGNRQVLLQPRVTEIADRHNKSVPQVVYRFALQLGMLPLTGTTDGAHMRHNLDIFDFTLPRDETGTLLGLGRSRRVADNQ